jgi:L-fuconolactonase
MPPTAIIDAHVHLWDPNHFRIRWIDDIELLNRRYALDDYRSHTAGVDITAFVYVQVDVEPAYGLLEAQWVADRAQEDPRLQGIVAWAPLEYGARARAYLDALVRIDPRIKGVRRILQGEADPAFCLRPDFVHGVRLLAEYGLSFDICINHRQLGPVAELVRQCPDVAFMLDHLGKPGIAAGLRQPWWAQIEELAALPNVMCKVSGVVTEADHQRWSSADIAPYVEHVLAAFGADRVAFGSDWPVVLMAADYRGWIETLDELTAHLTPDAQRKLWADNTRRFYRLGEPHEQTSTVQN